LIRCVRQAGLGTSVAGLNLFSSTYAVNQGKGRAPLKKIIVVLLCCLLFPGSVEAKDKEINLQYIPRDKVKVHPKNVTAERIYFEEVDDIRSRPKEIGENKENKGKPIKILTSKEDEAGKFLWTVLKNEFQEKGFKVGNNTDEASKIISITLLKFWTLEESRYNTEIQLRIEVRDKKREPYFKKTYSSTGTNSGRSLSDVNYNECISDALARMTENLFSDLEFLKGLAEKPKPPRDEEKSSEARRIEEKRLEEIKAEIKRLEELKTEEKRAREKQEEERRAEEKRLEEKRAREKQEEERRAEEKRLEELKNEVQRLEKLKTDEKKALEKHEEEKKAEEKRLEELKAEVKKLEELKALKEEILAEEKRAEEKKREEEKRAKEKRSTPAKPKPADPVFGPK
jgi:flagellar biosynthesis GTPase FlhF